MRVEFAAWLKSRALELGFDLIGFADAADPLLGDAVERYSGWVEAGYGATMEYLRRHTELKAHPEKLLPGWRSVVCVGTLYGTAKAPDSGLNAQVSLYTRGADYHEVMRERLDVLAGELRDKHGVNARGFVDAEPVLERFWAWRAGLGWIGKNAMLINRKQGSFLFLGGLLVDASLSADSPSPDHCGRCRKCIDACPTVAITDTRQIESDKCIAYHTIENRGSVPKTVMEKTGRWIAGCDICQNVCPWNDPVVEATAFETTNPVFDAPLAELAHWSAEEFKAKTKGVAMGRMKYAGFIRNLAIAVANSTLSTAGKAAALAALEASARAVSEGVGREGALEAVNWARDRETP